MQQSVPSTDDGKSKIVKFMEIFFLIQVEICSYFKYIS